MAEGRGETPGLLVLTFCTFVAVTTEMMPIGLLPAISTDLGLGEGRTGLLISVYAFLVVLLAVPLTSVLRKLPGKQVLFTTMIGYLGTNLVFATASGFNMLLAGRVLGGATHAVFFSIGIGYATRLASPAHLGRALALVSSGSAAGLVIGSPLATSVGDAWGWRASAWGLTVLAGAAAVLVFLALPKVAVSESHAATPKGNMRDAALALLANLLGFLGQFTLYTYVAVVLIRAGAHQAWVAGFLFLFGIFGVAAIFLAGRFLDLRPRMATTVVLAVMALCMLAIGVGPGELLVVVVFGTVWNAFYGPLPAVYQSAAVRAQAFVPELTGAWLNATSNVGIAVGALLGGYLVEEWGTGPLALVAAAFVAASLVVVWLAPRAFPGLSLPRPT